MAENASYRLNTEVLLFSSEFLRGQCLHGLVVLCFWTLHPCLSTAVCSWLLVLVPGASGHVFTPDSALPLALAAPALTRSQLVLVLWHGWVSRQL
jgi:hypothetical protein